MSVNQLIFGEFKTLARCVYCGNSHFMTAKGEDLQIGEEVLSGNFFTCIQCKSIWASDFLQDIAMGKPLPKCFIPKNNDQ